MITNWCSRVLLFSIFTIIFALPIRTEALTTVKEVMISAQGWNDGYHPTNRTVAITPNGYSVIVWVVTGNDGFHDIYGQRFDPNGRSLGREFKVSSDMAMNQYNPAVTMTSDGHFVIAWEVGTGGQLLQGVKARMYTPDGLPVGSDFFVSNPGGNPAVAIGGDGSFIVAYEKYQGTLRVQRYSPDGQAIGSEISVGNDYDSEFPAIAMNSSLASVICWRANWSAWNVYTQRLTSDATPIGSPLMVATALTSSVSMSSDGSFVITWNDPSGIFAQKYLADGSQAGSILQVSTFISNKEHPTVTMAEDGSFTITWAGYGQDGSGWGIYAQRYSANGVPVGMEFLINKKVTTGDQVHPSAAMASDGSFVVTWSGHGIYAKFYKEFYVP